MTGRSSKDTRSNATYLIPITVPIFREGDDLRVTTDWKRALELLRNSLEGRYGRLVVAATVAPHGETDQPLERVDAQSDDIELMPLFDRAVSARRYWSVLHREVMGRLRSRLETTSVLHGTVEEPARPFCYGAVMEAARARLPIVFVQDQDVVRSMRDVVDRSDRVAVAKVEFQARAHEYQCRRATRAADLCFFKGRGTIARYGALAREMLAIEDTSYTLDELTPESEVRERLESLMTGDRPLRFGYCGRLVQLKGLDRSLRLLAAARARGADLAFDLIGTGPEEAKLRSLAAQLGLSDHVRFVGGMSYGRELIARLGECDALLFNPRMSETPRMFFDAYAAGLPLVADGIDYVLERSEAESAALVLPWNKDDEAVDALVALDADRSRLVPLTEKALAARVFHAAESWYRRRAEATHAMVDRVRAGREAQC